MTILESLPGDISSQIEPVQLPLLEQEIHGPTVVDLFAGCGGLSLGLEEAGFQPIYVNEINTHARESYISNRENRPGTGSALRKEFHSASIKDLLTKTGADSSKLTALDHLSKRWEEIWDIKKGDIDLIAGGQPRAGAP